MPKPALDLASFERHIGRARVYKGFAKILSCHAKGGVRELEFQKREDSEIFRAIKKDQLPGLVEWEYDPKNENRLKKIKRSF